MLIRIMLPQEFGKRPVKCQVLYKFLTPALNGRCPHSMMEAKWLVSIRFAVTSLTEIVNSDSLLIAKYAVHTNQISNREVAIHGLKLLDIIQG